MSSEEADKKAISKDDKSAGEDSSSRWRLAEHVFAVIGAVAALIAIASVIIVGIEHTSYFEMRHEEHLVGSLIPGDDYAKMAALIGTEPDFHESLHSGRQLYVFDRRWEYIQLLVDQTDTVLSVGIYAKTTAFKATLVTGVVVNGAPVSKQLLNGNPIGAQGTCGASFYYYYEGYSLPDADQGRSVIIGDLPIDDTNGAQDSGPFCHFFFTQDPCAVAYAKSLGQAGAFLSSKLVPCLESSKSGQDYLAHLKPAVVIITAPYQSALPDMLNSEYFFTLANS